MFVYEGHRVKVKVILAESLFWQCKTLIGSNSGYIKQRAIKFACSKGFLAMAD